MLATLMIPFYLCVKDEDRLKYVNDIFTKVIFAPVAIFLTVLFLAFSMLLLPFAYLSAIVKKIKVIMNFRGKVEKKKARGAKKVMSKTPWVDLLLFIILGLPMLVLAQLKDTFNFLLLSYRRDVREFGFDMHKEVILTEEQFENLELFVAGYAKKQV